MFPIPFRGLTNTDSLQIIQSINKSFSLHTSYPDSALQIAEEALKVAETQKDTQSLVNLWRIKGLVHYKQHNMELALPNFEKSYAFAEKINHGKSRLLINLGNTFYQQQVYEKATEKYKQALEFNTKGDTLLSLDALNNLGSVCISLGKFDEAIGYYKQSLVLQKAIDNLQIPTYVNMAQTYYRMNHLDSSIATYQTAINIAQTRKDTNLLTIVYRRMGNVYKKQGAYFKSIQVFQKALDLVQLVDNKRRAANILHGMGSVFYDQKNYEASLEYAERGMAIALKAKDFQRQSAILTLIGNVNKEQKLYPPALAAFQQSKQITEEHDLKRSQMYSLFGIGDTYERQTLLDSAFIYLNAANELAQAYNQNNLKADIQKSLGNIAKKRGKLSVAFWHYDQAVKAAQSEGLKKEEAAASKLLADLLKQQNKDSEALFYLERYLALKDTLFNEENTQKIAELEASYQFDQEKQDLIFQNEVEKQKLDNEIKRQRIWQIALGVGLLLSLLALFFYIRAQRLNAEINLQQLKYEQKERERLAELDTFKSRFFTNIAHELRTPLALILGPVSRLLKNKPIEEEKEMLNLIQDNGTLLLSRVNEILDLAKIESNAIQLENTSTNLYEFTNTLVSNFKGKAKQKSQTIVFDYPLDKELTISLDQSKFRHIFNNYLSNALKFTPEGGQITISISSNMDASHQTPNLLMEVKDNGRGIPEKDLPQVFDRFFQSETNGENYAGAGIGLALCKEMAALMNGKVEVKSKWGIGSIFSFQFPLEIVESVKSIVQQGEMVSNPGPLEKKATKSSTSTILIVEDNPQLNDYLQLILGKRYQVVSAKNGKTALEKLKLTPCDLILSDIMMPIMDGFQLLEKIKTSTEYCHLPFIMLTAKGEPADKLKALRIGVDDYLIKPFDEAVLLSSIHQLLINQRNRIAEDIPSNESLNIKKNTITNADLQWLAIVETILKKELSNSQFTFDQLANQLFISRSQLQRRLKKITGLTPNKYFREIRLQSARSMLGSGRVRTVSEAAYAVGFETPKYFVKIYQERFSKHPKSDL